MPSAAPVRTRCMPGSLSCVVLIAVVPLGSATNVLYQRAGTTYHVSPMLGRAAFHAWTWLTSGSAVRASCSWRAESFSRESTASSVCGLCGMSSETELPRWLGARL